MPFLLMVRFIRVLTSLYRNDLVDVFCSQEILHPAQKIIGMNIPKEQMTPEKTSNLMITVKN